MLTLYQKQFFLLFLRPVFLVLDFIAVLCIALSFMINIPSWDTVFLTLGSTFIALSLSLPIALYYQLKHSSESFKILQSCEKTGIQSVFISRRRDSLDIRTAIDEAARKTSREVFFQGIAFKSFFDPNYEHTTHVENLLKDYHIDTNNEASARKYLRGVIWGKNWDVYCIRCKYMPIPHGNTNQDLQYRCKNCGLRFSDLTGRWIGLMKINVVDRLRILYHFVSGDCAIEISEITQIPYATVCCVVLKEVTSGFSVFMRRLASNLILALNEAAGEMARGHMSQGNITLKIAEQWNP